MKQKNCHCLFLWVAELFLNVSTAVTASADPEVIEASSKHISTIYKWFD